MKELRMAMPGKLVCKECKGFPPHDEFGVCVCPICGGKGYTHTAIKCAKCEKSGYFAATNSITMCEGKKLISKEGLILTLKIEGPLCNNCLE